MKQTKQFLIYGATGFTGKLTARAAKDRGLTPILAGRNKAKLNAVADELGFEHRAFELSDTSKLDAALCSPFFGMAVSSITNTASLPPMSLSAWTRSSVSRGAASQTPALISSRSMSN